MSGAKPNKKGGGGNGKGKDTFIATTAGVVVFTGIGLSLFKAFKSKRLAEEVSPLQPSYEAVGDVRDQPQTEATEKSNDVVKEVNDVVKEVNIFGFHKGGNKKRSSQTIEIFKGDSLWSLSRKYGVSVDQIKAANKYTDDTIYAGEKLIIP
jgi:LysM repeat protein